MGSQIPVELKEKAFTLRKLGKSYNEIRKTLGLKSKGTLSAWFQDLKLTKEESSLLEQNIQKAHERGLFLANKNRSLKIKKEKELAFKDGLAKIKNISQKDLLAIGIALYWGEGMKSPSKQKSEGLIFSNSDPDMIKVFIKFLREIMGISEERIRSGIHIYPNINPDEAKKYWSKVTGLPYNRFYIVTQVSRASSGKRPFNKLPYGTLALKVNNRIAFFKIKGMIDGVIRKFN